MNAERMLIVLALFLWPILGAIPADHEKFPVVTNSIGMKFVMLSAGAFPMGSPFSEAQRSSDESLHEITLTKPFGIGVHEVTQAEYRRVIGENPSHFTAVNRPDLKETDRFPVEQVTWEEATFFCQKLGDLPEEKGVRLYRLPTEAEWEYACRATISKSPFHTGASLGSMDANFHGKYPYGNAAAGIWSERTVPVGTFKPNAAGLYDMHGNVWEWCADKYDRDYYLNSPPKDPTGPRNPDRRVVRGGSWRNEAMRCRSAFRGKFLPDVRADNVGFRVVVILSEPEKD